MTLLQDISLKDYSTMRLGGNAQYLCIINNLADLQDALQFAKHNNLKLLMIGGGSNLIFSDSGYKGLILINNLKGLSVDFKQDKTETVNIKVASGEIWDNVVRKTVNLNLSGLEFLSLIPGLVGSTVIQNVGAYGQEISNLVETVEVYDTRKDQLVTLTNQQCQFAYRSSIFNSNTPNPYLVLGLTLKLSKAKPQPPFYPSLNDYLIKQGIKDYNSATLRQAVIQIRQAKLPDPTKIANCGSFFKNPNINKDLLIKLLKNYPDLPHWSNEQQFKLSAAWLISQLENIPKTYKGFAIWPKQPLVIINQSGSLTADLVDYTEMIKLACYEKFAINLTIEPQFID